MKHLKLILACLLAVAMCGQVQAATVISPSCEKTIGAQYRVGNEYRHDETLNCGDISHYQNSSGAWKPVMLKLSDAVEVNYATLQPQADTDAWMLDTGTYGYVADLSDGTRPVCVKVAPRLNGSIEWTKYVETCSQINLQLTAEQVTDKILRLYVDTANNARFSFYIHPRGFRIITRLKQGYNTNNNDWAFNVTLGGGLTRTGRCFYDGETKIGCYRDVAYEDAAGNVGDVSESIVGDTWTWSVPKAVLDTLTYPVIMQ